MDKVFPDCCFVHDEVDVSDGIKNHLIPPSFHSLYKLTDIADETKIETDKLQQNEDFLTMPDGKAFFDSVSIQSE